MIAEDFKKLPTLEAKMDYLRDKFDNLPDDDPDARCTKCDGYGHVIDEHGARPCECVAMDLYSGKMRTLLKNFNYHGIPPFLEEIEKHPKFVRTCISDSARNFFESWCENDRYYQCRVWTGDPGAGKTLFAMSLCREFLHAGKNAVAIYFPQIVALCKRGIDGNKAYWNIFDRIDDAHLVFVDEPGWERVKSGHEHDPLAQDAMRDIVSKCFRQRHLIIATNLSFEALSKGGYLTSNVLSRLRSWAGKEGCEAYDGEDLRSKKLFVE